MRFAGFIGPSYTLQSVNVDCQKCVNLFPEIDALGTGKDREVASLVSTPGLKLLTTFADGPIRGIYNASNSQVFIVVSDKLYRLASDWTSTELGTLGTDSGLVSMTDNGLHVIVVDGQYGYTWTIATDTFAQITDPDFFSADTVTFQDGYFIANKKGTQQFFISGLYDITWDALDVSSVEGLPDNLVACVANNQNLFMLGTESLEVFYNSGDADFPFVRNQGAVIDIGCAAVHSICKLIDSLFWIGGDASGSGIVYKTEGFKPVRISTPAIESVIRGMSSEDIASSKAWCYQQGGHAFYCLNLTGVKSTWCYDVSTGFWHERTYSSLWNLDRHRADCHAVAFGVNVVGDYETGALYQLDPLTLTDNGTSISRIRAAPHISKDMKFIRHNSFQLDMETGVGLDGSGNGTDPKAILRWSDDGGHSWSNEHIVDIGKIGKTRTRVIWRRLGMSRDRVYEVKISEPVKVTLIGAELGMEEGVS